LGAKGKPKKTKAGGASKAKSAGGATKAATDDKKAKVKSQPKAKAKATEEKKDRDGSSMTAYTHALAMHKFNIQTIRESSNGAYDVAEQSVKLLHSIRTFRFYSQHKNSLLVHYTNE
jgi:hypothetical protein